MMQKVYDKLLCDLKAGDTGSVIFKHHIDYVNGAHYVREKPYESEEPDQIVADFIASMTDDYFVELYGYLFPKSELKIEYKGYFEE